MLLYHARMRSTLQLATAFLHICVAENMKTCNNAACESCYFFLDRMEGDDENELFQERY